MENISRRKTNKNENTAAVRKRIMLAYLAALACMFLIVLWFVSGHRGYQVDYGQGDYIRAEKLLTDREGNPVEPGNLSGTDAGTAVAYFQIPEMDEAESLVFHSRNVYIKIYVENELIYETDVIKARWFQDGQGSRWNIVTLDAEYGGKLLELQMKPAYSGRRLQVENIFWGDRAAIVLAVIRSKLFSAVISLLMGLLGLFLILVTVIFKLYKRGWNHNLLYLGMFSLIAGAWCLIETGLLQFFVDNTQLLQAVEDMLLFISIIPLILYTDCVYKILRYPLMRILCVADLILLGFCIVLPVAGISDWHGLLPAAHACMAVFAVFLVLWVINEALHKDRERRDSVSDWLQLTGVGMFGIASVFELVRYFTVGGMDKALLLRIGLLFFILCFGVSSQVELYRLVEQGKEYDFVKKLAYSDGLTNLGNRTAYLEALQECVEKKLPRLGIVFFDVNNLKLVNDFQGHDMGDKLLQMAAEVIRESFGCCGRVYRIGGDEFCALLPDGEPEKSYEEAMLRFRAGIRERNETERGDHSFKLQIAQGFACCQADSMETVNRTVEAADANMYRCKAMLKEKQAVNQKNK